MSTADFPLAGAEPTTRPRPFSWLRREVPFIGLLLAICLLSFAVISPFFEFPLIDDWVYALSVRILVTNGHLQIPDWAAATIVAQVIWGALFAKVLGFSFSAVRLSTLTLSFLGSVGLYGICRELEISPRRALAGAVAYWFNPLTFSLSYTFMSDIPAISLVLLSTFWYLRGARRSSSLNLLAGSCLAALAFLVRQPAILVVPAVLSYGLVARWSWRRLVRYALAVAGLPFLVVAGYLTWTHYQGVPHEEDRVIRLAFEHGYTAWVAALLLGVYVLFYIGLFCLPLTLALLPSELDCVARVWKRGRHVPLLAWTLAVPGLVLVCYRCGIHGFAPMRWMPYLEYGAMLHRAGIGPDDIVGNRVPVFGIPAQIALTVLSALSLFLLGVLVLEKLLGLRREQLKGANPFLLPALVGAFQFAALFPVSAHVLAVGWVSFDRYLLPLVPFAIISLLWLSRHLTFSRTLLVATLFAAASLSLAGTHDWLSYNQLRWKLGQDLIAHGVPQEKIDAGMEWDGWYLYKESLGMRRPRTVNGPFWTHDIALATDSTYVVSFSPMPGYTVLAREQYRSWLHAQPVYLYLLQRQN